MEKPPKPNPLSFIRRGLRWLPALLWLLLLYGLSASPVGSAGFTSRALSKLTTILVPSTFLTWVGNFIPALTFDAAHFVVRKGAHVLVFGVLAFLLWWALVPWRWAAVGAWVLSTMFAVADEWHQAHVPARTASIKDVALDSAAALVVVLVLARLTAPRPDP